MLDIHTGFGWVAPGKFSNGLPMYLDDVARDFPDLKIVAFHMGYPHCDDLNMVAMAHKNVFICISLVVTWSLSSPHKFAKMLGEAMRWVGPDKIIWGSDDPSLHFQTAFAVRGFRDFKMPEELKEKYGYLDVTDDDKRKYFLPEPRRPSRYRHEQETGKGPVIRRDGNMYTLGDIPRKGFAIHRTHTAIVFEGTRITYGDLEDRVNRLANSFSASD